ncbi:hypothetical protein P5673_016149 [Acropora cervicornis]|uniref:Cell death regulator Aven n=1 Tax=Acropora cervicornis TaxID=6130 RepID=A0AAD9V4J5_ACRCE|nr:hypothetical protein P5673_016149 [Acropora cervicornis]
MRPDEHKRKQRADYKKKHGISSKKAQPKGDKETSKDEREAQHLEKVDLGENDQANQHQFARRKVNSNWERYEEANPAAHFCFQSEKDWDQELLSSSSEETASALNIDFVALATSLNNVPLHKRLNISVDCLSLPRAMLHRMNQPGLSKTSINNERIESGSKSESKVASANKRQVNHHKTGVTIANGSPEQFNSDTKKSTTSSQSCDNMVMKVKPSGKTSHQPPPAKSNNMEEIKTSLKDAYNSVSNAASINGVAGKGMEPDTVITNEDEELEFLLSLDSPRVKPSSDFSSSLKQNTGNQSARDDDNGLEDWLDSILD